METEPATTQDPADLRRIATCLEDDLRHLHKQLRRAGHHEASCCALAAADHTLAAARSLAAEFPQEPAAARAATAKSTLRLA